jgi:hypothetical protein
VSAGSRHASARSCPSSWAIAWPMVSTIYARSTAMTFAMRASHQAFHSSQEALCRIGIQAALAPWRLQHASLGELHGSVGPRLRPGIDTWTCEGCGTVHDITLQVRSSFGMRR